MSITVSEITQKGQKLRDVVAKKLSKSRRIKELTKLIINHSIGQTHG